MKKRYIFFIILLALATGFFVYRVKIKDFWLDFVKPPLPQAVEYNKQQETNNKQQITNNEGYSSSDIVSSTSKNAIPPTSFNLNVPFTSQAPFADWDATFKEACEEASALMIHYYYQNKELTPQTATDEILKMVDWQVTNWGGHYDLTASQTAALIKEYLGYKKVEIIDNPTIDEIKSYLADNLPVIVPAAGRLLGNPHFRQPGPIYHMLVIKGYTGDEFITNDPGTKYGHDYLYNYDVILNSLHDWNSYDILKGEKKIMIIYPN